MGLGIAPAYKSGSMLSRDRKFTFERVMMTTEKEGGEKAGMWAIVELFGHNQIAGFMSEWVYGGQGFIRVDVPEVPARNAEDGQIGAHSKMFGPGAIYAINPVDEAIATAAARNLRHAPVSSYGLRDVLRSMPADQRDRLLEYRDGD